MSPRTGRPPTDTPKAVTARARMSADDLSKLDYCCKQTGKTRSEIIREGIDKIYQELIQTK